MVDGAVPARAPALPGKTATPKRLLCLLESVEVHEENGTHDRELKAPPLRGSALATTMQGVLGETERLRELALEVLDCGQTGEGDGSAEVVPHLSGLLEGDGGTPDGALEVPDDHLARARPGPQPGSFALGEHRRLHCRLDVPKALGDSAPADLGLDKAELQPSLDGGIVLPSQ